VLFPGPYSQRSLRLGGAILERGGWSLYSLRFEFFIPDKADSSKDGWRDALRRVHSAIRRSVARARFSALTSMSVRVALAPQAYWFFGPNPIGT
jgi:hypothetical protein